MLNKYFLGDINNFRNDKINIISSCLKILNLYLNIQKKTKNNSLELFFLKRFFNYLRLSFGNRGSLFFLLKLLENFKFRNFFLSMVHLILKKLRSIIIFKNR